ncbi:hypothetical protein [Scytonema sp. PCC 10023]
MADFSGDVEKATKEPNRPVPNLSREGAKVKASQKQERRKKARFSR